MDKVAGEQENEDKLEELAGGSDNAFKLMRLWTEATQAASGNRFTLDRHKQVDPVENFIKRAKRERFSDAAIKFYVEEFVGKRMPRGWKSIRGSEDVDIASELVKIAKELTAASSPTSKLKGLLPKVEKYEKKVNGPALDELDGAVNRFEKDLKKMLYW